jgi:myo-inositol catabolism protein IolC
MAERTLKPAVAELLASNVMSSRILEPPECGGVVRLGLEAPRAHIALGFTAVA